MHLSSMMYFFCFSSIILSVYSGFTYSQSKQYALSVFKIYQHSYYNPMTGELLNGTIEDTERSPFVTTKITFRGLPCTCLNYTCGCCAGLNISVIKFDRHYCVNSTFYPSKFMIDVKVIINENEVFNYNISMRNPPPVCVPLPYVPVLEFCLQFHDLMVPDGNNLHACIDLETRVVHSTLLVLHFNCVHIDTSGIAWIKPDYQLNQTSFGSFGNNSTLLTSSTSISLITMQEQTNEVFDLVDFEAFNETHNDGFSLNVTTISPEDEDKIGDHRWDYTNP